MKKENLTESPEKFSGLAERGLNLKLILPLATFMLFRMLVSYCENDVSIGKSQGT